MNGWMNEFGRSIESVRPVLLHARNNFNDNKEVIAAIEALQKELKIEL